MVWKKGIQETCSLFCDVHIGKKIVCSTIYQSIRKSGFSCKEHSIRRVRLYTETHHYFSSAFISFRITS